MICSGSMGRHDMTKQIEVQGASYTLALGKVLQRGVMGKRNVGGPSFRKHS